MKTPGVSCPDPCAAAVLQTVPQSINYALVFLYSCLGLTGLVTSSNYTRDLPVAFLAGYFYTDFWFWGYHCWLDREENTKSRWSYVKRFADDFQCHHDNPSGLTGDNHLASIEGSFVMLMVLAYGAAIVVGTSSVAKLAVSSMLLFGSIGILNHYYCHARNHKLVIPSFFHRAQDIGLLPSHIFHKRHHTAPFDTNWSFLCGLGKVFEFLHATTGSTYTGATIAFVLCCPFTTVLTSTYLL